MEGRDNKDVLGCFKYVFIIVTSIVLLFFFLFWLRYPVSKENALGTYKLINNIGMDHYYTGPESIILSEDFSFYSSVYGKGTWSLEGSSLNVHIPKDGGMSLQISLEKHLFGKPRIYHEIEYYYEKVSSSTLIP